MIERRGLFGKLAGVAAMIFAVPFWLKYRPRSLRFRMTVEVDTPQGMRSGSSVYETSVARHFRILPDAAEGFGTGLKGQAVVVDLPQGTLFVLLDERLDGRAIDALAPDADKDFMKDGSLVPTVERLNRATVKADLPRKDWPKMVRFRDITDPKSVEAVDPAAIGVKRIMVATTKDAVTTGIEKRLGWLGDRGHLLDSDSGPTIHPTFAQTIFHGAFRTEDGK